MEIKKNAEENLEQLGKQEKYLFSLNGSFRQDKDKIDQGFIMRTRRSEIVSAMMSHIAMLLSWFFWQVLSLDNSPDWKESSHHVQVHVSKDSCCL